MSEGDSRLRQVLRDSVSVPPLDHERVWTGIRTRRSERPGQRGISRWFWFTLAAIATVAAAWFGVRVFPVTTGELVPVAGDSIGEVIVREPVMQTTTQPAPTAAIPLLGHRSSLLADLDHLASRRMGLAAEIANARAPAAHREVLQQELREVESQLASTRVALQIVDEQLAGLRTAGQAVVAREAVTQTAVPAPETIVIGGGEPLALWVAGTGAIVVLAVVATLVWVRRTTRAAFRELAELRSQAGNQHAVVSEAIDAIALEIERIGESQRFLAKSVSTPHVN